jgi:putative membrane protein
MDYYNYLNPHLIFVITWFAGLFYIVRLFVYQIEAAQNHRQKEILQAQYKIMTYRLWYITHFCWQAFFAYWMLFFTDLGKAYKCLGCM